MPKEDKARRKQITVEVKRKIIEGRERGMRVADLKRMYNKSTSTICTILKNKDKIKKIDAAKGVTRISTQRPPVLEDVEKLLLVWIKEKQTQGETVNESAVCEKAKQLYAALIKKTPGSSTEEEKAFKASRGWFEKFKRRAGVLSAVGKEEAGSLAEKHVDAFQEVVHSGGYLPQQVFSCRETSLFWRRMPKVTHYNDRLTLLFCANASGDLQIEPLLVCPSDSPETFEKYKTQKNRLNVTWRSNASMTRDLFTDWINEMFGPAVKKYLLQINLPLRVLLVMNNSPAYPPGSEKDILEEFQFIKFQFLPPLLQPKEVISNFKQLYTKAIFQHCFEITEDTNLSVREFWKDHFHILTCLKMIDKAWKGVTKTTLISAWKKLWPGIVVKHNTKASEKVSVSDEIVSLAKVMGLEIDTKDIDELVEEHGQELPSEEHEDALDESLSEDEDMKAEHQSSSDIEEMLEAWDTVALYVEKHHPNKEVAIHATNLFNDYAVSHFREILMQRQYQMSADHFLFKRDV